MGSETRVKDSFTDGVATGGAEQRPEDRGPDKVEEPQHIEDQAVADAGHGRPDQQRPDKAPHAADQPGKTGDGPDLVLVKELGRHADHRDGGTLVGEPGNAEEGDGHSGGGDKVEQRDERHQAGGQGEGDALGVDEGDPTAVQPTGKQARKETARVGGEERQPGEEGDLLQIQMADGDQIEGHPEAQRGPGGVCEHPGQGDGPEVAPGQQRFQRDAVRDLCAFRFPANQREFVLRDEGMFFRGAVGDKPEHGPGNPEDAGYDEGDAPVVMDDGPGDHGWGEHGSGRGADTVDPAGQATLPGREPLGGDLHPGGVEGGFGKANTHPEYHHGDPGAEEPGQRVKHGPEDGHHGEDPAYAEAVHDVAGTDPAHRVGKVKGGGDPGILLFGKADIFQHGRGGDTKGIAGQVVGDGAQHDQDNNVPSQILDFHSSGHPFLFVKEQVLMSCLNGARAKPLPAGDTEARDVLGLYGLSGYACVLPLLMRLSWSNSGNSHPHPVRV